MSGRKIRSLVLLASGGCACFSLLSLYQGNEKFYSRVAMPIVLRVMSPETAHGLALKLLKWGLAPNLIKSDSIITKSLHWGLCFNNPIGLAAGFDKDAEALEGLLHLGFGFVEVGSVTPEPQPGNDKPSVFRLIEDNAVINRCGFNSKGHANALANLESVHHKCGVVGVSLGKNKDSENAANDYVKGVEVFGPTADYLVINVSSPNTPGLRTLQEKKQLELIVDKVLEARTKLPKSDPPILLKISPDISEDTKKDIAAILTRRKKTIDGLIVSNTTTSRPDTLKSKLKTEEGGLSGEPLRDIATKTIRDMYSLTYGKVPIIGVGGISSGKDAYEKIRAGASLLQLYTALVYEGFPVVQKIKRELGDLLIADGYNCISDAIGADHRQQKKK